MPAKKNTEETPDVETPGGEVPVPVVEPNAAQAAAAEAGVVEPKPDVPDGMMAVPFRGADVLVPKPTGKGRQTFLFRQAIANNDIDRMLAAIVGDVGTMQIAALITDDDDPNAVIVEFFKALGEVTGQGNS